MAQLSQETGETAQAQAKAFEESLAQISGQLISRTQEGLDTISSRVEGTRLQAEEINSTLQATMVRFGRETQEAARAHTMAFDEKLRGLFDENLSRFSQQIVSQTQAGLEDISNRLEGTRSQAERVNSALEATLTRFSQETQQAAEAQAASFVDSLNKLAGQIVSGTQEALDAAANRLQGARAQAQEMNGALEATMSRLSQETQQAAQMQAKALEGNLATVSEGIVSRTREGMDAVSSQVEATRVQAVEMNLALQATLARFTKDTQEAGQAQARAFEERLARISDQIVSRAQAGLEVLPQRVEGFRAQAQEMNAALDATLGRFTQKVEGFRAQAQEMNSALGATMTRLAQKVDGCRAQAEELNAALGSSLTRFGQRTAEVGQTQIKAFEEKLAKVTDKFVSRTQSGLDVLANRVDGCRIQAEDVDRALEAALARSRQTPEAATEPQQGQARWSAPRTAAVQVPNRTQGSLATLGVLLFIGLVAAVGGLLGAGVGRPRLYEVPADYHGWVVVKYQDSSCQPLKSSGLYSVVTIPASGRACTSSPVPAGWHYRKSEAVTSNGARTELQDLGWDKGSQIRFLGHSNESAYELFFVGTNDELNRSWGSKPSIPDDPAAAGQPGGTTKSRSKSRHSN
jgi:hypothetical protein